MKQKPEVRTRTFGNPRTDIETEAERENLPDEVEEGKTYRDARIRRRTRVRLRDP